MIDYALAPFGATHFNSNDWLNKSGDVWFKWSYGSWVQATLTSPLKAIPDREHALNQLAELCHTWHSDRTRKAYVHSDGDVVFPLYATESDSFSYAEWLNRRTARIEAGLIKESSDLADINAANWDGKGSFPPVGSRFEFSSIARKNATDWAVGILKYLSEYTVVIDKQGASGEFVAHPVTIAYRPIRTPEQVATENKKEWVDKALTVKPFCRNFIELYEHVYDAMLSGELKVPKGDL